MFIGTLFSDRIDRDNPIDLRFHRNLETSTRKFLEIHLKLSESENADRAIGNQISDINLEMLQKKSICLRSCHQNSFCNTIILKFDHNIDRSIQNTAAINVGLSYFFNSLFGVNIHVHTCMQLKSECHISFTYFINMHID